MKQFLTGLFLVVSGWAVASLLQFVRFGLAPRWEKMGNAVADHEAMLKHLYSMEGILLMEMLGVGVLLYGLCRVIGYMRVYTRRVLVYYFALSGLTLLYYSWRYYGPHF